MHSQINSLDLPGQIKFTNFNAFWSEDSEYPHPALTDINIEFRKGLLYGIGGKTGSGKSNLLRSILNELPFKTGNLKITGTISYVSQQPIIFSNTIR